MLSEQEEAVEGPLLASSDTKRLALETIIQKTVPHNAYDYVIELIEERWQKIRTSISAYQE